MRLFCGVRAARWLLPWGFACVGFVRVLAAVLILSGREPVYAQEGSSSQDVLRAPPPAPPLTELDESKPPAATSGARAAQSARPAPAKPEVNASGQAASGKPAAGARKVNAGGASKDAAVGGGRAARSDVADAASSSAAAVGSEAAAKSGAAAGSARGKSGVAAGVAADGGGSGSSGRGKSGGAAGAAADGGGRTAAAGTAAAQLGAAGTAGAPDEVAEPGREPPPPPAVDGDFAGSGEVAGASGNEAEPQEDFAAEAQEYVRPDKREYSVRIDLLNWLLLGRLSFELEMSVWKYLTVSLTPVFVVARSPIAINYAGLDDPLTQRSHGIGPLSGVSLGVGAWFWGEPFKGYVVRLELTNYGYSYRTADSAGAIDRVDFTERRLIMFIGSHSRFGAFTFAGGFGLGYELNQQTRCGLSYDEDSGVRSRSDDCKGKQQIALDREIQERSNLNGPLHPVYFQARFSLGVVF